MTIAESKLVTLYLWNKIHAQEKKLTKLLLLQKY